MVGNDPIFYLDGKLLISKHSNGERVLGKKTRPDVSIHFPELADESERMHLLRREARFGEPGREARFDCLSPPMLYHESFAHLSISAEALLKDDRIVSEKFHVTHNDKSLASPTIFSTTILN